MKNDNWIRSISKTYKQLNENQMMMGMQGGMQTPPQKKFYHYPMQRKTAGPWQDQGPGLVEPPKQQQMPFPGPGMPGEIPGPSGLPVSGPEKSTPMMGMGQPQMGMGQQQMPQMGMGQQQMPQMGMGQQQMPQMGMGQQQMPQMGMGQPQMGMGQPQMGMGQQQMPQMGMGQQQMPQMGMGQQQMPQMGMGQPQQQEIQIAQMGTFKQPFGEVPGQMPQMGMGQPQIGAPGQNIQQALSNTRPITKIEPLENRDVPNEFRYSPVAQQQQQGMGGMPQGMGGMPQGMGQAPMGQRANQRLSPKEIKAMFDKIKRRGLGKK